MISSHKNIEPAFIFFVASYFYRYAFVRTKLHTLLTNLNIPLLGLVTCRLKLDGVYLDIRFVKFYDNFFDFLFSHVADEVEDSKGILSSFPQIINIACSP